MADGERSDRGEPPFEGGSQPVHESRQEVPGGGRTAMQTIVIVLAVLVVLAGLIWFLIPAAAA
jgi:hypothetical protein